MSFKYFRLAIMFLSCSIRSSGICLSCLWKCVFTFQDFNAPAKLLAILWDLYSIYIICWELRLKLNFFYVQQPPLALYLIQFSTYVFIQTRRASQKHFYPFTLRKQREIYYNIFTITFLEKVFPPSKNKKKRGEKLCQTLWAWIDKALVYRQCQFYLAENMWKRAL